MATCAAMVGLTLHEHGAMQGDDLGIARQIYLHGWTAAMHGSKSRLFAVRRATF